MLSSSAPGRLCRLSASGAQYCPVRGADANLLHRPLSLRVGVFSLIKPLAQGRSGEYISPAMTTTTKRSMSANKSQSTSAKGVQSKKSGKGSNLSGKKAAGPRVPAAIRDPGEAAYAALQPRLAQIAAERVVQPRAQVSAAASFVLSTIAPRLSDKRLRARFASLPAAEFDHSALDDLVPAAHAALWAQAQLAAADAGVPGARLPEELISQATELRQLMLAVCDYHFRDDVRLSQQVADIRSGTGYLDLAEDLRRLSALYRSERETLKQDLRFYKAKDADTALHLSQRITSELRPQSTEAARQISWRTWALLLELYEEIARGGRFLLRQAGESAFPLLHAAARVPVRRSRSPKAPPPASPPAPPA